MVPHMCIARLTCHCALLFAALLFAAPARADDLSDFNAAVEMAMSHHRVALGYLRTGNVDLATLELDGMRQAWGKVGTLPRPAVFRDRERYTATMLEIAAGLVGTTLVLNMGRADVARESLEKIRASLSALRRESRVTVLADCVLDANTAMDALFLHNDKPNWSNVVASADAYRATLQRCDAMAAPNVKSSGEFRRLIDGALASLAQVPKAIETRDGDLLHRLLIELRSFDNLLAFRYG
jgi:hypothetical protein